MQGIGIHADFIIAIALSPIYGKPQWASARRATLSLMQVVLTTDVDNLANNMVAILQLQPDAKTEEVRSKTSLVNSQLWSKFYSGLTNRDAEAITLILGLAARSARLDILSKEASLRTIRRAYSAKGEKPPQELLGAISYVVDEANACLAAIRNGFLNCMTRFADYYSDLQALIGQDEIAKHLICMLLSPVEDYNVAAQTLIAQAYDVDIRAQCFRELLKVAPQASLQGLISYLANFSNYAEKVNEACSVAKALVRSMTDVIEVLGNPSDGLLRDPLYVKRNSSGDLALQKTLPELWKTMTTSIAVIFRRTPRWAVYFESKIMVEWMRDALIFGRDLLERRHAFEQASMPIEQQNDLSTRKVFPIRKAMIDGLQDVFLEVQAWLRLTDMELLYQSFALLKSLLQSFHESGVKPSQNNLDKLRKFIAVSRRTDGKSAKGETLKEVKRGTFLNPAHLAELDMAVAEFEDDEIEIISVKCRSRASSPEIELIEPPTKRKAEGKTSATVVKSSTSTKQTKLNFTQATSSGAEKPVDREKEIRPVAQQLRRDGVRGPKFEGSKIVRQPARPSSPDSSSSNEESDTDALRAGPKRTFDALASLNAELRKKEEFLKKAKPERRQIKIIDDPLLSVEVERRKKQQEARRASARMKPDISRLHRVILTWNYDHAGDEPPYTGEKPQLRQLKLNYDSYGEYRKLLEPLLMLECWAQIVKSKEEMLTVHEYKIVGRSFVDDWLDLDGASDFKQEWRLNPETDIVLLRHTKEQKCILAKVTVYKRTTDTVQIGLRCSTKAFPTDPGLAIGSVWRLSLVFR